MLSFKASSGRTKKGYTTLKVQVVGTLFRQGNDQVASRRGNGLSGIPLQPCHSVKKLLT